MNAPAPLRAEPRPTPETAPFWDHAAQGELWLPRCRDTGRFFFPPRAFSPFTGGPIDWEQASGRATLASFLVVHQPAPGFAEEVPYVVALARLEEGPHLMTNLPGAPADPQVLRAAIGAPLELTFEQRGDHALPQFRLVDAGAAA
ncbi:Zn-ribbon domain-containing OB-fold protein [Novosphingobium bradum]|uniref:Zn-ribbon domain-containing OB-fold protein n=1 Tax=Novosphingobium bradum TaxID=1737444 RepID=A0ABV7IJJ5_9SPHN